MAEITIKSAPATFEAHGELASYFGQLTTDRGIIAKVVADVRKSVEDTDPEGNTVQSWHILGYLTYERGKLTDIPRELLGYAGEFLSIIDQLNGNDNGTDNSGV